MVDANLNVFPMYSSVLLYRHVRTPERSGEEKKMVRLGSWVGDLETIILMTEFQSCPSV